MQYICKFNAFYVKKECIIMQIMLDKAKIRCYTRNILKRNEEN